MFIIYDNLSNYLWYTSLSKKNSQLITNEFSITLSTSKRSLVKLESDRGKEW